MTDLTSIYDILKASQKYSGNKYSGEFGIEIETEVDNTQKYDYPRMKYWDAKKDGSLRDYGVEYVLKAPGNIPEIDCALDEFVECDKRYKFRKNSVSTSVHVHTNMLNDTFLTLVNFITIYSLMENHLIRKSGEDRLSNLFCLPMIDAEGIVPQIEGLIQNINKRMFAKPGLNPERTKYAALNLSTLHTIGTAEIRTFRGETNKSVILEWINIISKLKEFSRQSGMTPRKILDMYKTYGANTLIDLVFQEYSSSIKLDKKINEELIKSNLKYAARFAVIAKDWSKFGIFKVKPVYKEKIKDALDKIAIDKFGVPYSSLPFEEGLVIHELYHQMNKTQRIVDVLENI